MVPPLPPLVHSLSAERLMGHHPSGRPPTLADRPAPMAPFPHNHPGHNEERVAGLDTLTNGGPESDAVTGALLSTRGTLSFADAAHLRDYTSSLSSLGDSNRTSPASATQGTEGTAHAHLGLYGLGVGIGVGGGTLSSVEGGGGDSVVSSASGIGGGWVVPNSMGTTLSVTAANFVSCGGGTGGESGSGGSGAAVGSGVGRPEHLSASIAQQPGGGDSRLGVYVSRAETGDGWGRQDNHGGVPEVINTAPDSGLTHPLYNAIDGLAGYPGVNGLTPCANDRRVHDSTRHPAYGDVGSARGEAIWQPRPFFDAAPTAEQYQQLAGLGPWAAVDGGDRNRAGTGASLEAATAFPCSPRAYAVHAGPSEHRPVGVSPSVVAAAPRLQPPRASAYQEVHKEVREQLRQGNPPFDDVSPGGETVFPRGHGGGGRGTATDGEAFPSAHIWSFGEASAKDGVPPAAALGHAYNPWSVRGWRTPAAATELHRPGSQLGPAPPADAPPH